MSKQSSGEAPRRARRSASPAAERPDSSAPATGVEQHVTSGHVTAADAADHAPAGAILDRAVAGAAVNRAVAGAAVDDTVAGIAMDDSGTATHTHTGTATGGIAARPAATVINAAAEDAYWRDNYQRRPYADDTLSYDHYRPAYRYGWEARARYPDLRWGEVERDLERGWREHRGSSRLGWGDAKLAARDAWQRIEHRMADEREERVQQEQSA